MLNCKYFKHSTCLLYRKFVKYSTRLLYRKFFNLSTCLLFCPSSLLWFSLSQIPFCGLPRWQLFQWSLSPSWPGKGTQSKTWKSFGREKVLYSRLFAKDTYKPRPCQPPEHCRKSEEKQFNSFNLSCGLAFNRVR